MSEFNKGPMDFHYLLKRRRVSLERWAEDSGILTKEQFAEAARKLVAEGYGISEAMFAFGESLPSSLVAQPSTEPDGPQESEPQPVEVPTEPKSRTRKPKVATEPPSS